MYARRIHSLALGAALSFCVGGCPGSLQDPERFQGSTTCPPGVDVENQIFKNNGAKSCVSAICHDHTEPAGELDLESPDPASRMIGKQSSDVNCSSRLLIDPQNPEASFLYEKVSKKKPSCGDQMPNVGSKLLLSEIDCVHNWILQKAYGARDGGVGGSAGSGGTLGSGGTAGSAGQSSGGGAAGAGGVQDAGAE